MPMTEDERQEWRDEQKRIDMRFLAMFLDRHSIIRLEFLGGPECVPDPARGLRAWGYNVAQDECEGWDGESWRKMSLAEYQAMAQRAKAA